jgi:hypothetical protein
LRDTQVSIAALEVFTRELIFTLYLCLYLVVLCACIWQSDAMFVATMNIIVEFQLGWFAGTHTRLVYKTHNYYSVRSVHTLQQYNMHSMHIIVQSCIVYSVCNTIVEHCVTYALYTHSSTASKHML